VDEIQTGFGVTGEMWYSDRIGLDYDILIFGKKSQIMGINVSDKYSSSFLSPLRILEVTFDGDLVDAIRSEYILRAYERGNLLELAKSREKEITSSFEGLLNNFRATGNLWAFDFDSQDERDSFCSRCFDKRLLVNKGGINSVRMRPNLAVKDAEIDEMLKIIKDSI
jgi:L-lysine 6-transaminase